MLWLLGKGAIAQPELCPIPGVPHAKPDERGRHAVDVEQRDDLWRLCGLL